ncbi:outer membrane protein assembly factor BamB family protein [Stratiformator vulcanicus]|uniref:Outer membrane biogenesis protein BamB n=1 Tax=Stratiformator vulcanicus TaxID=2527980 RepID=A0A517R4N4_9PLAN|nr:PQQ-binding-like beta-propeller repeat protein [Stratiformator vulcanicus]QDT38848.1 outer membrane biogenesis protein BamB [Stratiformator vulcanicus]
MIRRFALRIVTLLAIALLAIAVPGSAAAQFLIRPVAPPAGRMNREWQPYLFDRDAASRLDAARQAIDDGEYAQGVRLLMRLNRTLNEDVFLRAESKDSEYVSAKTTVRELLTTLPPEGRRTYRDLAETESETALRAARARGDAESLRVVADSYPGLAAGEAAAYELACRHLDRGDYLRSALLFERLIERPQSPGTVDSAMVRVLAAVAWARYGLVDRGLERLSDVNLQKVLAVSGTGIGREEFTRAEIARPLLMRLAYGEGANGPRRPLERPLEWRRPGGDGTGNLIARAAAPIDIDATAIDLIEAKPGTDRIGKTAATLIRRQFDDLVLKHDGTEFLQFPATYPLIVDGQVVVRSFDGISSFSAQSAARRWSSVRLPGAILGRVATHTDASRGPTVFARRQTSGLEVFTEERAWQDLATGTLTSDGEYAYAVELSGVSRPLVSSTPGLVGGTPFGSPSSNIIAAYSVDGGRLVMCSDPALETFFLGPPQPWGDRLYAIGEVKGEVRLHEFARRPGLGTLELVWSQSLVVPEMELRGDSLRRFAGLTPVVAGGVLICPTASGVVIAVDPASRRLLWESRYERNLENLNLTPRARLMARFGTGQFGVSSQDAVDRWAAGQVTISHDRVFVTSRDSDELLCLSLTDGELLWKTERGDSLYLASADEERVYLAGPTAFTALDAKTGEPAWPAPVPIKEPSGQGVRCGDVYHIPLRTGVISTISLEQGMVLTSSRCPDDLVPGNLAVADGVLVAQSPEHLIVFPPLAHIQTAANQFEQTDQTASALELKAASRLHLGDEEQGIELLRAAAQQKEATSARDRLFAYLEERLRIDPASKERLEELYGLGDAEDGDFDLQRRRAEMRLAAGETAEAVKTFLNLAVDTPPGELERIDKLWSASRLHRIAGRLAEIYAGADPATRLLLDRTVIDDIGREVFSTDEPDRHRRFVDGTRPFGAARPYQEQWINSLSAERRWSEAEREIQSLVVPEEERRERLAVLYRRAELPYAEAANRADPDAVKAVSVENDRRWTTRPLPNVPDTTYEVQQIGAFPPQFDLWNAQIESDRTTMSLSDGKGSVRFRLDIRPDDETIDPRADTTNNKILIDGHIAVAVLTDRFVVFDLLSDPRSPRRLYAGQLQPRRGEDGSRRITIGQVQQGGRIQIIATDPDGFEFPDVGPLIGRQLMVQSERELRAVDVLTGKTIWTRGGIAPRSETLGDQKYVISIPPRSDRALVLRTVDGAKIGWSDVPENYLWEATHGRHVVIGATNANNQYGLAAIPLGEGTDARPRWFRRIGERSQIVRVGAAELSSDHISAAELAVEELAVKDEDGTVRIIRVSDGHEVLSTRLPIEVRRSPISDFVVMRTQSRYLLFWRLRDQLSRSFVSLPTNRSDYGKVDGPIVAIDRDSGEVEWSRMLRGTGVFYNQPRGLPLVFLFGKAGTAEDASRNLHVTALDLSTGDIAFNSSEITRLYPFELRSAGRAEPQGVDLLLPRGSVRIQPEARNP